MKQARPRPRRALLALTLLLACMAYPTSAARFIAPWKGSLRLLMSDASDPPAHEVGSPSPSRAPEQPPATVAGSPTGDAWEPRREGPPIPTAAAADSGAAVPKGPKDDVQGLGAGTQPPTTVGSVAMPEPDKTTSNAILVSTGMLQDAEQAQPSDPTPGGHDGIVNGGLMPLSTTDPASNTTQGAGDRVHSALAADLSSVAGAAGTPGTGKRQPGVTAPTDVVDASLLPVGDANVTMPPDEVGNTTDALATISAASVSSCAQAVPAGWLFVQGRDTPSNDISNAGVVGDFARLTSQCSQRSDCLAVNTNGWMKHTVRPATQWHIWSSAGPCQGILVKHTGVSWNREKNVRWAHNCDFRDFTYATLSIPGDQCGPACFARPSCTHFVWSNNVCSLKHLPDKLYDAPAVTGGGVCGVVNWNFDAKNNVKWMLGCEFHGRVYSSPRLSAELCGPLCNSHHRCTHFVHHGGVCYLKSYIGSHPVLAPSLVSDSTVVCGSVVNWNFDTVHNVKWMVDWAFPGDAFHRRQISSSQCGPACNAHPRCTHFVHRNGVCNMIHNVAGLESLAPVFERNAVSGAVTNWTFNTAAKVKWMEYCEFHGHVYKTVSPMSVTDCGPACGKDSQCTHFVAHGEKCFMKSYPDDFYTMAPTRTTGYTICGVSYENTPAGVTQHMDALRKRDVLVQYAPQVYLHPDEKYYPMSVSEILQHAANDVDAMVKNVPIYSTGADGKGRYYTSYEEVACWADKRGETQWKLWWSEQRQGGQKDLTKVATYAFYIPVEQSVVHLTYWFFFPFNSAFDCYDHDGDWERITVRLVNNVPQLVVYGAHGDISSRMSWTDVAKTNGHPHVYMAKGSHGTWPWGCNDAYYGNILNEDETGAGQVWETWNRVEAYDWTAGSRKSLPGNLETSGTQLPDWLGGDGKSSSGSGISKWGYIDNGVPPPQEQAPMTEPKSEVTDEVVGSCKRPPVHTPPVRIG